MSKKSHAGVLFNMALFITAANFLGKILGFLRDVLISNYYGATPRTDAFFLAFSIPTILIGVFTSAADSAIVPQYHRILEGREGRTGADRYYSNIITILSIFGTAAAIVSLLFPEKILLLFAPTFRGEQLAQACSYLRIFSFAGLFHIWYCFFCAYLLCYERTTSRVILSFAPNVLVVLALLFNHDGEMYGLSIAYLGGTMLSAALPIAASWKAGYRYRPSLSVQRYHFPEFIRMFLPIMASALLADLLMYCDRFLASFLQAGSLSSLNYASKIISVFDNIAVIGIGAVLLPVLSRLHLEKKQDQLRFTISAVSFCAILVLLPVALLCIDYSYELVSVLYLRGAFTVDNAKMVSGTFVAYGMQILLISLQSILVKSFHSMGDTKKPFQIYLITFTTNIVLSIILMQKFEVFGIALATTFSTFVGCTILFASISRRVGLAKEFFNWRSCAKVLASVVMLFIPAQVLPEISNQFLKLIISGGASFILYLLCAGILFRKELRICLEHIR